VAQLLHLDQAWRGIWISIRRLMASMLIQAFSAVSMRPKRQLLPRRRPATPVMAALAAPRTRMRSEASLQAIRGKAGGRGRARRPRERRVGVAGGAQAVAMAAAVVMSASTKTRRS